MSIETQLSHTNVGRGLIYNIKFCKENHAVFSLPIPLNSTTDGLFQALVI